MKVVMMFLALLALTGCAQFGNKVTVKEGDQVWTYSEAAFAQKMISENQSKAEPCKATMADLDPESRRMALFMQSHGQAVDLCGWPSQVAGGRNYFDSKDRNWC